MGKQKKGNQVLSDIAQANAVALRCYLIIAVILILAYLLEFIKNSRTIGYFVVFTLLALVPLFVSFWMNKKNPESTVIKEIIAYGYSVLYAYALFTATSPEAFVYIIPIFIAIAVYANKPFTIRFAVVVILINVAQIAWDAIQTGMTKTELASVEIRIAVLVICCIFLIMVAVYFTKITKYKVETATKAKEESELLLEKIMNVSGNMAQITADASYKMNYLHDSLTKTMMSMQEVSEGTSDTVNAVQSQLEKTEQIQMHVSNVEVASRSIETDMDEARREILSGRENVDMMVEQVQKTNAAGIKVSEELIKLNNHAKQMETIINVIDGVTRQTSLLALNASIEAARAGEAGKGFAVVATEISSLASQTNSATVEITEMINNISTELKMVVGEINELVESNKIQSERVAKTAESFEGIEKVSMDISEQSKQLVEVVAKLADANSGIVENIQTISAITEEVTAHSGETYNSSEENDRTASEVTNLVSELNNLAQQLKQD